MHIPELRSDEDKEIVKTEMDDAEFGEHPKCTSLITSSSIATYSLYHHASSAEQKQYGLMCVYTCTCTYTYM